jgi:hypothetical protein
MEAASNSETSVNFYYTTWRNIPEDRRLQHNLHIQLEHTNKPMKMISKVNKIPESFLSNLIQLILTWYNWCFNYASTEHHTHKVCSKTLQFKLSFIILVAIKIRYTTKNDYLHTWRFERRKTKQVHCLQLRANKRLSWSTRLLCAPVVWHLNNRTDSIKENVLHQPPK